jgi:hypothetical protein
MCLDCLYKLCLKYFLFYEKSTAILSYTEIDFHVKYPLLLSDFNKTWIFLRFSKNSQIPNFTKIRPVGAGLFHGDGQTDRQT